MKPFTLHFDERAALALVQRTNLPSPFYLGTVTAAYQVEGGYNGPGEPQTNWAPLERAGKVERTGAACRLFDYVEADLATMQRMGLNMFRLSIEWARVQPSDAPHEHPEAPPPFDEAALARYANILVAARQRGIEPCVTLHHFVHPLWAGLDLWLDIERVRCTLVPYVRHTVARLGELLERAGEPPVRFFITLNEINLLAGAFYLDGRFPHRAPTSLGNMMTACENLFIAHCLAYDTIHDVYDERGWPAPQVSTNTNASVLYHLDRLFVDLLTAREAGVPADAVQAYLDERRRIWQAHMQQVSPPAVRPLWLRAAAERLIGWQLARLLSAGRLGRLVRVIYNSPRAAKLDYYSFDYYDPYPRSQLGLAEPGERWLNGRPNLLADLSRQVLNPRGMRQFMHAYLDGAPSKPVLVAESGMCHRQVDGRCLPRPDGATRDVFLRAYVFEALHALADGVPLLGYLHWSYCDNYEWGSYKPRFGLFGVDFARGARRLATDAFGINAAGAFAKLAWAIRSGSPTELGAALSQAGYPRIEPEPL